MRHQNKHEYMRALPVKYCPVSGKVCFDKRGAQTAANSRFEEEHVKLRIYPCPDCQRMGLPAWHLTRKMRERDE